MTASETLAYSKTVAINSADTHWRNRIDTAQLLVDAGHAGAQYATQYMSGNCNWILPNGNSVIIAPNDTIDHVRKMCNKAKARSF